MNSVFTRRLIPLALVAFAACGGDGTGTAVTPTTTVTVSVASVNITPSTATVAAGSTTTLVAAVISNTGTTLTDRTVVWASSNSTIATVAGGVVTGVAAGSVTINATVEGKTATATVTVTAKPAGPIATLAFVSAPSTGGVGVPSTLTVQAKDASGTVLPSANVIWTTSNARIAYVPPSGAWTKCTSTEGATCTFTGQKLTRFGLGNTFWYGTATGSTLCSSSNFGSDPLTNIAKECWLADPFQSTGTAVLRPVGLGSVTVTAKSADNSAISATTTLTISGGTVTRWSLFCTSACTGQTSLAVGGAEGLWIVPFDAILDALDIPVTATSSSAGVAKVASFFGYNWTITGVATGAANITFAPGAGFTGPSYVHPFGIGGVAPAAPPISTMSLIVNASALAVGETTQLGVVALDASGSQVVGRTATFTSSNAAVATVSAGGLVTAVSAGTTTITAAAEGKSATAQLTVTGTTAPAAIASVAVTASPTSIAVGATSQLTTVAKDAAGNTLTGRVVSYVSSAPTVATVASGGIVTAVSAGTATITATSEGISGTFVITVTAAPAVPVATVNLFAGLASITIGGTTQLTAVTSDASNNVLAGRVVTFTSGTPAVATVSATGLITGVSAGTSVMTATSEGKSSTVTITVTAATPNVRLGFALVNGATNTTDPLYSSNGMGGAITVTSLATGRWHVVFAGMGRTGTQADFARVTPKQDVTCAIENYGIDATPANAFVDVTCQTIGGAFANTNNASFSVMFVGNGVFLGRAGFLRADNATGASTLASTFSYNSASAAMSASRTSTGIYTNIPGLFPRGGAAPEVPLVSSIFNTATVPLCESEGIDVFGTSGTNAATVHCRSGNIGTLTDNAYNQLIFSGGRTGTSWGFGYYYSISNAFDISPYQRTSDGTAVTFASNGAGGQKATLSSAGGSAAINVQIMPNFNGVGGASRWTTCGYGTVDRTAKTVEVICRDRTGAIVASDFVVVTFQ